MADRRPPVRTPQRAATTVVKKHVTQKKPAVKRRKKPPVNLYVLITAVIILALVVIVVVNSCASRSDVQAPDIQTSAPSEPAPTVQAEPVQDLSAIHESPDETVALLPVVSGYPNDEKRISITIDDLNDPLQLYYMLDLLEQYNMKATLFALGRNVEMNTTELKRAYNMGIEIGNHTYSHGMVYKFSDAELIKELRDTALKVNQVLGGNYQMRLMRPPGGNGPYDPRLHALLRNLGYEAVAIWNVDSKGLNAKQIMRKIELKPGCVVLFHTAAEDVTKLGELLPLLAASGYRSQTMSELGGMENPVLTELDPAAVWQGTQLEYSYADIVFEDKTRMYGVKLMQSRLIELGYLAYGEDDGAFGEKTAQAIADFKAASGYFGSEGADTRFRQFLYSEAANAYKKTR